MKKAYLFLTLEGVFSLFYALLIQGPVFTGLAMLFNLDEFLLSVAAAIPPMMQFFSCLPLSLFRNTERGVFWSTCSTLSADSVSLFSSFSTAWENRTVDFHRCARDFPDLRGPLQQYVELMDERSRSSRGKRKGVWKQKHVSIHRKCSHYIPLFFYS